MPICGPTHTKPKMTIVGLDEAGVGCIFGSMWACAVVEHEAVVGAKDSKKMTPRAREKMRDKLLAAPHGLGEVSAAEIDDIGLGEARRLVFHRALDDLMRKHPDVAPSKIVVDGTIFRKWRDVPFERLPRADQLVPCVAAASIIAKTTRDAQVVAQCDAHPDLDDKYKLRANKGYLSPAHIEGLRVWGLTPYHRASYRVRSLE